MDAINRLLFEPGDERIKGGEPIQKYIIYLLESIQIHIDLNDLDG